jgi:outer membrane protein TolC
VLLFAPGVAIAQPAGVARPAAAGVGSVPEMSLEECLRVAFERNRQRPASRDSIAVAEAQHRQALAAYWPQVTFSGGFQRLDRAPNFVFPPSAFYLPAQSVTIPGGTALVTVPPGVFGPAPVNLPVSVPAQTINTPAQAYPVPAQDVKLMDEDSWLANVGAKWLLVDGGLRKGYRQQAGAAVDIAKEDARLTDLEIRDTVTRFYYGAVLARLLRQLGEDTLARLEATLGMTEAVYKEGAGTVTKADYLDNKMMVETVRSMVAILEKNHLMSQAALANAIGKPWNESVAPSDRALPPPPPAVDLDDAVGTAFRFNPDWEKLEAALRAAEGGLTTAKSGFMPKLALTGTLRRWWNDYSYGLATDQNRTGWTLGAGVEIPLFDGFLTKNKVAEARAQIHRLEQQQFLLKDGLGLQVKDIVLGLSAASKGARATYDAMTAASENRELNLRAYQNQLVETDKVIRAQLAEAMTSAQYYMTLFTCVDLQSRLQLLVGSAVQTQIGQAR